MAIKAPFNFVPLPDKVFFPDWADQISQDIPFKDCVDGTIRIKITAQSPIFIRNGHTKNDRDSKKVIYKSFCIAPDGRYFIPGTSLKGCIRSVLEIMSYGKLDKNHFQNSSFGIRDFDGKFYRAKIKPQNIHCGWLIKDDNHYLIEDCGHPWRISLHEIDRHNGSTLESFVKNNSNFKLDENRSAKKKYQLFGNRSLLGSFIPDEDTRNKNKKDNRLFVKYGNNGEGGTIVFTGQPGERKKSGSSWTGKFFEFVFPDKIKKTYSPNENVINDFLTIHKNSPSFDTTKYKLDRGEKIPIFFLFDDQGNQPDAIGLAYMFKYPAYNQIYTAVPIEYLSDKPDLSDCIFGYVNGNHALKGRVSFGNAFAEGSTAPTNDISLTLSSPNPSFYPLYLGNGKTWNSETVQIAGRKRYPTRLSTINSTSGNSNMENVMNPLPKGTVFYSTIHLHNMRQCEVGAILAALTFDNHNECYHNLGSAKPLGYGKISIDIIETTGFDQATCLTSFETMMSTHDSTWQQSPTMRELLAMAKGIPNGREQEFEYMNMNTNRDRNEFLLAKKAYANGEQLGMFTQIINRNVPESPFASNVSSAKNRKEIESQLRQLREQDRLKQEEDEKRKKIEEERIAKFNSLIQDIQKNSDTFNFTDADNAIIEAKKIANNESEKKRIDELNDFIHSKRKEFERKKQEEDEQQRVANKKAKVEAGLEPILNEKKNNGEFKVAEYKVCSQKVMKWMKDAGVDILPPEQHDPFHQCILRLRQNPTRDEKRNKLWDKFDSKIWKNISEIVGEEKARQWFNS